MYFEMGRVWLENILNDCSPTYCTWKVTNFVRYVKERERKKDVKKDFMFPKIKKLRTKKKQQQQEKKTKQKNKTEINNINKKHKKIIKNKHKIKTTFIRI